MQRDAGYLLDMIHEYDDVDLQVVWDTVQEHLPNLIQAIEPLVPPPGS